MTAKPIPNEPGYYMWLCHCGEWERITKGALTKKKHCRKCQKDLFNAYRKTHPENRHYNAKATREQRLKRKTIIDPVRLYW